jgi:4-hydroxythreonine-4-phosphate dehydrogenase
MGDPAGIAPEITAAAWSALRHSGPAFVVLADPTLFHGRVPVQVVTAPQAAGFADALPIVPIALAHPATPGVPNGANAQAIIASIETAVRLAQSGEVTGVVTNPISKAVLMDAGFAHPGHTEFLAALTGVTGEQVMMLAAPGLRVVPVTIHVSLRRALDMLSTAAIVHTARITHRALIRDFGIAQPRLAIAGLNPHAGEAGHMGDEERTLIEPAISALRTEGINATGPYAPDTMFTATARTTYDVAICHYHDQALIPLKTLDMWGGVNITLGLPIVRTSPDHGTAFGIAGQGVANPESLIAALRLAETMARYRAAGGAPS